MLGAPAKVRKQSDRRSFIGGSDAWIIMGGDEAALLRLWREKRGEEAPEDLSGNLAVMLGCWSEAFNRQWYERAFGERVSLVGDQVFCPDNPWRSATLDGYVAKTGSVWEAKHTNAFAKADEVLARYAGRTGLDLSGVAFYEVFAVFKLAVVLQQIFYRYHRGQTDDPRFAALDERVMWLARVAARLQTRFTPALQFKLDEGVKKSVEISRLIDEAIASDRAAHPQDAAPEADPDAEAEDVLEDDDADDEDADDEADADDNHPGTPSGRP